MEITHIRIRKLQSMPGFNNVAVELEAKPDPHETYAEAYAALEAEVDRQLAVARNPELAGRTFAQIKSEIEYQEGRLSNVRSELSRLRAIVNKFPDLADLATEKGLTEAAAALDDEMRPF